MGIISKATLRVTDAVRDDAYKDIVRVHYHHRGKPVTKVGTLVRVSYVRGKEKIARVLSIRGLNDNEEDDIRIDHVNRNEMRLTIGDSYEFTIESTHWWEKLSWACKATDPGVRIAMWIAVWSGLLGIIGVILGVIPIVKDWSEPKQPPHVYIQE